MSKLSLLIINMIKSPRIQQREWNEEYQSCRELPSGTMEERIIRDRTLFKIHCDFVDAATKGAK